MSSDTRRELTTVAELSDGPQRVEVNGKKLLVCEIDGEVHAYRNVCPHQYGPAIEGRIEAEGTKVVCPWHGWTFDLQSGRNALIDMELPRVDVVVRDGSVYIDD